MAFTFPAYNIIVLIDGAAGRRALDLPPQAPSTELGFFLRYRNEVRDIIISD